MATKRAGDAENVRQPARRRASTARRPEAPRKNPKSQNRLIRYFQDTRDELRKVTWPGRDEIVRLTIVVLIATIAASMVLGLLDFIFQRLAGLLV